jgi:glucose dehydrogenase
MRSTRRTGHVFSTYWHDLSDTLTLCCSKQSRGVAMLGDRLYMTTLDARLVARDAETGEDLWHKSLGGEIIAAPIAYLAGGRQQVTIAAGHAVFTFGLKD